MTLPMKNATMSSMEIAEIAGKLHKNVMRDIRNMEVAWTKITGLKFELMFKIKELANGGKRKEPYYELTQPETLYIATKFNDEARARLILRWMELEKGVKPTFQLPESFGRYPEKTVITVRMGELSNQIYIVDGVVFAKFAPISLYIGYISAPTYYLPRFGQDNSIKVTIGKQEAWFINAVA